MYIEPNTDIKILMNCPLEPNYEHTIHFFNTEEQATYFAKLTKFNLTRNSYQRVRKGVMRVEVKTEDLYDCNYIMFRNSSFGRKYFYAFITSVEYVNNITSEITYELDVMQTWMRDYVFKDCFVERNHTLRDEIGDNILPENLELGEYTGGILDRPTDENGRAIMSDWVIVVAKTANTVGIPVSGGFYGGTYHMCNFKIYEPTADGITDLMEDITLLSIFQNQESILGIYMMPRKLVYTEAAALGDVQIKTFWINKPKNLESLGGYVPKNKKLFTYPYNFLRVTNLQGITNDYKYEFFSGNKCEFMIGADTTVDPTIVLMPDNYNGLNTTDPNYRVPLNNFPKGSFVTNDFGAKLVQAAIKLGMAVGTGNAGTLLTDTTITTREKVSKKTGEKSLYNVTTKARTVTKEPIEKETPLENVAKSLMQMTTNPGLCEISGDSSAMYNLGYFDFCFRQMYVRPEYARMIDDYFSMFGYKINRVMQPQVRNRPHWTYIKTANCAINGHVPGDDAEKICDIHNRGITYWTRGEDVGNYMLDNSPR